MTLMLVVLLAAGCGVEEDLGTRLRRECESAWGELAKTPRGETYGRDFWISRCIDERAMKR